VFALGDNIGPEYDIPAPDVNTNSQIMAWFLDSYLSTIPPHERNRNIHVVTGKPVAAGGSLGRDKATGQGVVYTIQKWAEVNDMDIEGLTFTLQGFGNVGHWASSLLVQLGARMVAVEDITGGIRNEEGIDPHDLLIHARDSGGVARYPTSQRIDHVEFMSTPADIFIPAALEQQITGESARWLDVRLVAEAANGPTTPKGDEVLQERNIDLIPDILCNAGGVIVSYFEWLQNKRSEFWELEEVDRRLLKRMTRMYEQVAEQSLESNVDYRTAAYMLALRRLERVYLERSIFP
jgi:glutamate dehydrogenase (NAD(P)+)